MNGAFESCSCEARHSSRLEARGPVAGSGAAGLVSVRVLAPGAGWGGHPVHTGEDRKLAHGNPVKVKALSVEHVEEFSHLFMKKGS